MKRKWLERDKALREIVIQKWRKMAQLKSVEKNGRDANHRLTPTKKAPMQMIVQFMQ